MIRQYQTVWILYLDSSVAITRDVFVNYVNFWYKRTIFWIFQQAVFQLTSNEQSVLQQYSNRVTMHFFVYAMIFATMASMAQAISIMTSSSLTRGPRPIKIKNICFFKRSNRKSRKFIRCWLVNYWISFHVFKIKTRTKFPSFKTLPQTLCTFMTPLRCFSLLIKK